MFTKYISSELAEAYRHILLKSRSGIQVKSTQATKFGLYLTLPAQRMRYALNFVSTTRKKDEELHLCLRNYRRSGLRALKNHHLEENVCIKAESTTHIPEDVLVLWKNNKHSLNLTNTWLGECPQSFSLLIFTARFP